MTQRSAARTARQGVFVDLIVNSVETLALGAAALVAGSVALRAQMTANAAEVAVAVFLLIGVLSSARPPSEDHPLGYGRDRFFWSLFAALGIFVGGGGFALDGALRAALHPSPVDSYPLAYSVLFITLAFDTFTLAVALRPLRRRASANGSSLRTHLRASTDPASTTVVVSGGCAVLGGVVTAVALVMSQAMDSPAPDTVGSAIVGLILLTASFLLLHTNRELLVGRGVPAPMLREMRRIVAAQRGVVDVPDLFAVVIGPASLIVNGDVVFADNLDVRVLEQAIFDSLTALRTRWPVIEYVYLTPVPHARPRGIPATQKAPQLELELTN